MLWWFTPVHFSQHVNLCWLPAARPMPACSFSCLFLHDITNPLRTFSCVCTCLRLGQQTTTRTAIVLALALQFFLPICVHLCRVCVCVCVWCARMCLWCMIVIRLTSVCVGICLSLFAHPVALFALTRLVHAVQTTTWYVWANRHLQSDAEAALGKIFNVNYD